MNIYGIFGCSLLFFLWIAILWASDHEERVKLFFHDLAVCLRCINNGEDL